MLQPLSNFKKRLGFLELKLIGIYFPKHCLSNIPIQENGSSHPDPSNSLGARSMDLLYFSRNRGYVHFNSHWKWDGRDNLTGCLYLLTN